MFSYCLLDTPIPLLNYVAHLRLLPVTDGNRTFWQWESRFDTPPGEEQALATLGRRGRLPGRVRRGAPLSGGGWLRSFGALADAASSLSTERGARFLAGGTLVMRAINEGDVSFATIIRTTDPVFGAIRAAGERIEIGAGVTMAQILGRNDLACTQPHARSAARRCGRWQASAAICSRRRPMATLRPRCLRSTRR
jgi:FAD binding domain in molybdopterin dehydrogenase